MNKETNQQQIAREFYRLRNDWKTETVVSSSLTELVENSNYQKIIAMGLDVVPLIFEELERDPDWWFYALRQITEVDPTNKEDMGNLGKMTESWLKWSKNQKPSE